MDWIPLFNSSGRHIANLVRGHLHTPFGRNIGRHLKELDIFIDLQGHYLGEIVFGNRLFRKRTSPHTDLTLGTQLNFGDIGNYGDPGNIGDSGIPEDYLDVPFEML